MTGLSEVLRSGASGLYRTSKAPQAVVDLGQQARWRTIRLDTTGAADKDGLMRAVQEAFALPDWFGRNWDALADSLSDVQASPGVLVVWSGSRDLPPQMRRTTQEILAERSADPVGGFVTVITAD